MVERINFFLGKNNAKNVTDAGPEIIAGLCELKRMIIATAINGLVMIKRVKW